MDVSFLLHESEVKLRKSVIMMVQWNLTEQTLLVFACTTNTDFTFL